MLFRGERWRILGLDPDPTANVWIASEANPDRDAFTSRLDLDPIPKNGASQ